ncbi:DUF6901 family protein [Coraliomargarita akajimensis]|uniref:Uncharacterized protein n=1 Tax=Coraliomargarita akajimensis (strain DSM 45221 / IAM 15411 / JCM 23193 / KCTC 12865 / 04OKA010-24) TaxID=583355 RepID=D5EJC5_CORAD|nr:hypothetical protein [Coraliomargarita akajimensis]ADE54524.1 conserved hypothetical protein [Coraliomargarita akajimensis DSM 45221]
MSSDDPIEYTYHFKFPDSREYAFDIRLDAATGKSLLAHAKDLPEWAELDNHRCSHCPLKADEHFHCPAAASVVDVVETFRGVSSIAEVEVEVVGQGRRTRKDHVALPSAIAALLGARFAGSDCPIMARFRPMVRHHLPFATFEEARFRMATMHALAQLIRLKDGLRADWNMESLGQMCQDVNQLNIEFSERLKKLCAEESTTNALSGLDSFVQMIDLSLDEDFWDELKRLFEGYLD